MRVRMILAFVVLAAGVLAAQTFRGTILGTVTDASGAVVSGAKVTVKNVATGLERTTQTSADGSYSVPELPLGTYTVTITQSGFQTAVTTGVVVDVATERRVDAQLKTGQVEQRVEVMGEDLPQVQTTSAELGGTLTTQAIENLPVNGRDYTKLIYLNPGVAGSPDQISDSPGSFGVFSMNGARGRANNFLLDGTDMNDGYRNDPAINEAGVFGTPATILPVDAVAELRVISHFEPEYGRNAGATVNIVTKSGTNALHGSAIEFFRNNALDARNYFNPSGQPAAPFHNNQFGGSLGGPIVKDKTFFFVNYEGQREKVGVVTLGCVPEPNRIAADEQALLDEGASLNTVTQALLLRNPWPAPNLGTRPTAADADWGGFETGCPRGANASLISPSSNRVDSLITKIDHSFNPANLVTGRYYYGDSDQSFPLALTASGGQLPGFNTFTPTRVQLVSLSYVRTIGSSMVNELRYGWNRFAEGFFPEDRNFHPSSIGLNTGTGLADQGLPIILTGSFAQLGSTSSVPRHRVDSNMQVIDGFSWKINKHDLKMGFEFRRTTIQQYFNKYFRGRLSFDNLTDLLAGSVDGGFQYFGNSTRHTAENSYGLYFQDSFRITPRLTFNYGLRWDYFGLVHEKNNLFSNITSFDLAGSNFTLTQVGSSGLGRLYEPDYNNFAPRASIAWDVNGKGQTVFRAGFGVFFDAFSQDFFLGHLPYSPFFDPGPAYNNIGPAPILSTTPVGVIPEDGSPVFNPTTTCDFECDVFSFDRHIRTPYMENYNLNFQHQLGSKTVLQVGYVGSQGHSLFRMRDLSQPSQSEITASDCAGDLSALPGAACSGGRITPSYGVPRRFIGDNFPYGAFYILQEESTGRSNYNALQASLRINGWRGITSIVNYVWSKSLDDSSDGEDFEPNASQPNDSTRPQLEYGPSNFNIAHRFTWVFGYDLPKIGGSMQRLKNGWGFNSTLTLQTGQPFQFNYNFEDDFSGSGSGFDRPDLVGPIRYHPRDPNNFVELSSFAIPCNVDPLGTANGAASDCIPGTRHFGTLGRNALNGPAFKQWDLAIYKTTALTERVNLQFRAEFFNILNHPNFANPFLPLFLADPGQRGFAISGNREVGTQGYQLSATGDVGIGNPFLGGGGPRGIQLAAKITF